MRGLSPFDYFYFLKEYSSYKASRIIHFIHNVAWCQYFRNFVQKVLQIYIAWLSKEPYLFTRGVSELMIMELTWVKMGRMILGVIYTTKHNIMQT